MYDPSIMLWFSPALNHNEHDCIDWYVVTIAYAPYELRERIMPQLRLLYKNITGSPMHDNGYFRTKEALSSFLTLALLQIEELKEFKLIGDLKDCL